MTTPMSRSSRCALLCAAIAVACVLLATVGFVHPVYAEPGEGNVPKPWVVECIECPHTIQDVTPQAAQIDSQGVIHVVYGGDALYHAWQTPSGWQVEVADPQPGVGRYAALAIDSTDRLHAVYLDDNAHTLRYAVRETTGWRSENVDPGTYLGANPYPAIAVDPGDQPRIAYYYPTYGDLYYLERTGTGWQKELVDSENDTGQFAALAVDQAGNPHIAYSAARDNSSVYGVSSLRYAVKASGTWTLNTVTTMGSDTIIGLGLALEPGGNAHLAVAHFGRITYFAPETGGWRSEPLVEPCFPADGKAGDFVIFCGMNLVLRLDAAGSPHLGYVVVYGRFGPNSSSQPVLQYAERTTGQWRFQATGRKGAETQLVLTAAGEPILLGVDQMALAAHARVGADWQTTLIDQGGTMAGNSSLAIDSRNRLHVSSYDSARREYHYSLREAGAWGTSGQPVFTTIEGRSDLALAPLNQPHVLLSQSIRNGPALVSMAPSLNGWSDDSAFVGILLWFGPSFDQQIDRMGVAHAVVNDIRGVVYLKAGNPPQQTVIDASGPVDGLSITLDMNGIPHVAYASRAAKTVRYGTIRAGRWITETVVEQVDADPTGPWSTSVALGPGSRPSIVYSFAFPTTGADPANRTTIISLLKSNGKLWETAWTSGYQGAADSTVDLAIDSQGRQHVAWYDGWATSLQYTIVQPDGTWSGIAVDSDWDVGRNPSLALDNFGPSHITYLDATRRDLKHAYIPANVTDLVYLPTVRK